MNKTELELQAKELSSSLQAMEVEQTRLKNQLVSTTERLESINKPIIDGSVVEAIREAVLNAISNFDFDDTNNFDYEFGIDYNNQLTLDNLDFGNTDDLQEQICDSIEDLFNVVEKKNDESKQN